MREICDRYGILLISDEVMSGWGRTGTWFAVDHWNVVPDIITTAKGITSGYVPLGAVIVRQKIADFFDDKYLYRRTDLQRSCPGVRRGARDDRGLRGGGTFSRTPGQLGAYLGQRLEELKAKHPVIGDVRYIGLFAALELVQDRQDQGADGPDAPQALPAGARRVRLQFQEYPVHRSTVDHHEGRTG